MRGGILTMGIVKYRVCRPAIVCSAPIYLSPIRQFFLRKRKRAVTVSLLDERNFSLHRQTNFSC